jgi:hypothetical protein
MRRGHASSGGAGGDAARLEQDEALALRPRLVEQRKRRPRCLASRPAARRARRSHERRALSEARQAYRRSAEARRQPCAHAFSGSANED